MSREKDSPRACTARVGQQLSVFVEDVPGALATLTERLGAAGINLYALTLTGGIDHGYVRLVADRHKEAMQLLQDAGELIFERDVVLLDIPNRPGALASVASQWAAAGINIEYVYCAGGPGVEHGLVVVKVDDAARAVATLEACGQPARD